MIVKVKTLFLAFILLSFNIQAQPELNFESILMQRDSVTVNLDSGAFGYHLQFPAPEYIVVFYDRDEGIIDFGFEVVDEVMVCFAVAWKEYLAHCI